MTTTVEAIYQDGVFRPVGTVDLPENQRVEIVVETGEPPRRGVPLEQVLGLAAGNSPPTDDETVRRWLDEYRMKKAGL
jgi:predicted DNA-binding antitoxin AbrB/MazE fold protein